LGGKETKETAGQTGQNKILKETASEKKSPLTGNRNGGQTKKGKFERGRGKFCHRKKSAGESSPIPINPR